MPRTQTDPTRAYVCLGSNIEPATNLPLAVERLRQRIEVVAVSRVYASAAKGAEGSPPFLNAAVAVETSLDPLALKFDLLRPLEAEMGRRRTEDPNEPRTIDLDLALFDDLVIDDPQAGLVLPDPEILVSAFVVLPLVDLAPDLVHPTDGSTLAEIARRIAPGAGVEVVDESLLAL